MDVYFGILFIIVLILLIPIENKHNVQLIIAFIILLIYAAIRVDYGSDYEAYKMIYNENNEVTKYEIDNTWETGFYYLCRIMPDFRSFIILTSFLVCFSYFILFKKYITKEYQIISFILLFFITNSFIGQLSGISNAIAINILMLSVPLLVKRKMLWFIFLMLFASIFHQSALLMIPIYFLVTPHKIKSIGIIFIAAIMLIYSIFSKIFLSGIIENLTVLIFPKYSIYMNEEVVNLGSSVNINLFGVIVSSIYMFIMFIILLYTLTKDHNKEQLVILKLTIFYYFVFFTGNVGLSSRFYFYFAPFYIVGNSIIISNFKDKFFKYTYIISILLFFGYFLFNWLQNPRIIEKFYIYKSIITHPENDF